MNCKSFLGKKSLSWSRRATCRLLAAIYVCLVFWSPSAVAAPEMPRLPPIQTSGEALKPGSWVEYSILLRKSGRRMSLRLAALEKEGAAQWYEMAVRFPKGRALVLKILLKGTLAAPSTPLKTVIQITGQPAFFLPPEVGAARLPRFSSSKDPHLRRVSSGKLKVPAGVFKVERFHRVEKGQVTKIWISAAVPGWPMIKLLSPSLKLELKAHGEDARSLIKGQPAEVEEDDLSGF